MERVQARVKGGMKRGCREDAVKSLGEKEEESVGGVEGGVDEGCEGEGRR